MTLKHREVRSILSSYRVHYDAAGQAKQQAIWLGDIPIAVVGSNSPVGQAASKEQKLAYIEADHLNTGGGDKTLD